MVYVDITGSDIIYFRNNADCGILIDSIQPNEVIYTQSPVILNIYSNAKLLSKELGVSDNPIGLYDLFSRLFDGKIHTDFDMVNALFNGFLLNSEYSFCLKIGVTFTWFKINQNKIVKLGSLQFSEPKRKYTVGRFIKRLWYNMAVDGVNLTKVKYLTWSENDIDDEFKVYIKDFEYLEKFFDNIKGLGGMPLESVMRLLSNKNTLKIQVTSSEFIDCLNDSFNILGISEENGMLISKNTYYKDYSTCINPIINQSECHYGIIIDCEGQIGGQGYLDEGCRELGGIIFCKYKNMLLNLDVFSCDERLLEDTLLQVIENYKNYSGDNKQIKVYTYGISDKTMLLASIENLCNKKTRKILNNKLVFIDCFEFIQKYLKKSDNDFKEKHTLTNVAKQLNVLPLLPKHNPLNDAKTLFNILAHININGDLTII